MYHESHVDCSPRRRCSQRLCATGVPVQNVVWGLSVYKVQPFGGNILGFGFTALKALHSVGGWPIIVSIGIPVVRVVREMCLLDALDKKYYFESPDTIRNNEHV